MKIFFKSWLGLSAMLGTMNIIYGFHDMIKIFVENPIEVALAWMGLGTVGYGITVLAEEASRKLK